MLAFLLLVVVVVLVVGLTQGFVSVYLVPSVCDFIIWADLRDVNGTGGGRATGRAVSAV